MGNIDIGRHPGEIYHDLREPLPYEDESVDFIFSEHFIEHLTRDEGILLLKECYRVMKRGAVIRFSQPNLGSIIDAYNRNDVSNQAWKPKNKCLMINEGLRFWNHKHVYDFEDFEEVVREAGFSEIKQVEHRKSEYSELSNLECRPYFGDLIVEFRKT